MLIRKSYLLIILLVALVWSPLMTSPTQAHPHAWIDARTKVLFNAEGRVTGLKEVWFIDELYSLLILEDYRDPAKNNDVDLEAFAREVIINLADYHHFTLFFSDKTQIRAEQITDASALMAGNQLELTFTAHLAEPLDPLTSTVGYQLFDPSYYIEILHLGSDAIRLGEGAPPSCLIHKEQPNPDAAIAAYAGSLGTDEQGDINLGTFFAEKVTLSC